MRPTLFFRCSLSVPTCLACLGALAGCGGGGASGTAPPAAHFQEFPVPVASNLPAAAIPGSWPDDLRSDDQGNLWFAQHHSNEVGRMSPNGVYTGYPVPTPNSEMDGIAVDSVLRIVWVTEVEGNKIVRVDMATGQVTEIPIPTPDAAPGDLALAADGTAWFTEGYEGGAGKGGLGRIVPATHQITEIPLPNPRAGLDGLLVAPDGAVWFVELDDNQIARYANGQFREFALPRRNVVPTNIARDSRGRLWVTEQSGNAIALYNPAADTWQEFPLPTPNALPAGIVVDRADNVWFTEFQSSKIGVIPAGTATVLDFAIPTADSGPEDICLAPNGSVYFTEQYGNKIGRITVTGLPAAR